MKFKPATEEDIAAKRVWPKGVYDFHIADAEEKLSASKGNPMIELTLEIARDGETRVMKDYLLAQRPEKLWHAAIACGVQDKYDAGFLSEDDFLGKHGRLELGIQKSKDYPAKNVVRDYVSR
jgi:hypothetical protein